MLETFAGAVAATMAVFILFGGSWILVKGVINMELPMIVLGGFSIAISSIILIALFAPLDSPDKYCLNINNTRQTVNNFEMNTVYLFYWDDAEQYRIPSENIEFSFTKGECVNGE